MEKPAGTLYFNLKYFHCIFTLKKLLVYGFNFYLVVLLCGLVFVNFISNDIAVHFMKMKILSEDYLISTSAVDSLMGVHELITFENNVP